MFKVKDYVLAAKVNYNANMLATASKSYIVSSQKTLTTILPCKMVIFCSKPY